MFTKDDLELVTSTSIVKFMNIHNNVLVCSSCDCSKIYSFIDNMEDSVRERLLVLVHSGEDVSFLWDRRIPQGYEENVKLPIKYVGDFTHGLNLIYEEWTVNLSLISKASVLL